jgi:hypothetical protein
VATCSAYVELSDGSLDGPYPVHFELSADWAIRGHFDWFNATGRQVTVVSVLAVTSVGRTRFRSDVVVPRRSTAHIDMRIDQHFLDEQSPDTLRTAYLADLMSTEEFVAALDGL